MSGFLFYSLSYKYEDEFYAQVPKLVAGGDDYVYRAELRMSFARVINGRTLNFISISRVFNLTKCGGSAGSAK